MDKIAELEHHWSLVRQGLHEAGFLVPAYDRSGGLLFCSEEAVVGWMHLESEQDPEAETVSSISTSTIT